jgi:hypothetical protein
MLDTAVAEANKRLVENGIEPIDKVGLHGLRRTYASLRCALGDDVSYTANQLGHTDAGFTLRTYTQAVRRREKLTKAERIEFDRAVEWARMGTTDGEGAEIVSLDVVRRAEKPGAMQAVSADASG